MEKWIEIKNQGEIELTGLTLMGACTKRDDESIGFFGSGNKYAIATLLRNNIEFKIFSGLTEIEVVTKEVKLKDKIFKQIIIDGENTSLTTDMGPDWEPWFVIREFWSNAIDEGGNELNIVNELNPENGLTKIYIDNDEVIKEIIENKSKYFLDEFFVIEEFESYRGKVKLIGKSHEGFNFFRKGISVTPFTKYNSLYWYDVEKLDITESRTYKYDWQIREFIAFILAKTDSISVIENYILNNKGNIEESAIWGYIHS